MYSHQDRIRAVELAAEDLQQSRAASAARAKRDRATIERDAQGEHHTCQ